MERPISKGVLIAVAAIATLVYGMISAFAGTIIPQLSRRLSLSPVEIGNVFLAQALGMVFASVSAGPLVDNQGKKTGFLLALTLIGMPLLVLPNAAGYASILACMVVLGCGGGMLVTASNTLVSDVGGGRRAALLTILKCFFGVGGFVTPFLGASLLSGDTIALAYVIAGLTGVTLLFAAAAAMPPPSGERRFKLAHAGHLLRSRPLYLFSLFLFLYISCEVGLFNWLAKHLVAQGVAEAAALKVVSLGLAMGLLIGRLAFAGVLMKVAAIQVTLAASAGMAVTTYLITRVTGPAGAGVVAFLAGVAMAPVFPGVLAMVGDTYSKMTGTAMGIVITSGWLGLAVSSRLIGYIAGGDPKAIRTALLVLPAFSVVMIAVNLIMRPMLGARAPASEAAEAAPAGAGRTK